MSQNKIILIFGIFVAAMPFLGFPALWKTIFYVVIGCILITMAVVRHIRRRSMIVEEKVVTEVYVQANGNQGR